MWKLLVKKGGGGTPQLSPKKPQSSARGGGRAGLSKSLSLGPEAMSGRRSPRKSQRKKLQRTPHILLSPSPSPSPSRTCLSSQGDRERYDRAGSPLEVFGGPEGWGPGPQIPADLYGEEAMRELGDKARFLREQSGEWEEEWAGGPPPRDPRDLRDPRDPRMGGGEELAGCSAGVPGHGRRGHGRVPRGSRALPSSPAPPSSAAHRQRHHRPPPQPAPHTSHPHLNGPSNHLNGQAPQHQQGYMSDGSETSMSIHSTQSERPRRAQPRRLPDYQQNSLDPAPDEEMEYLQMGEDGTLSDSCIDRPYNPGRKFPHPGRNRKSEEEKRKKSLMTRLIPNKGPAGQQKRLGFARSEEVGVPSTLSPQGSLEIVKQTSKESTDSSDSWLPVVPEGPLGDFVSDLGPGQVVGRQVLASPCLGEIQLGIVQKRSGIEVEIIRARNLALKPGAKVAPAPYVKVYLMEGKLCVAKAKTNISRRTTQPLFQQALLFNEPHEGRMLQVTVWGDYGRMERKVFMGIAQIRLDSLTLTAPVIGWYKLYHSSSLVGTSSPSRKDSDGQDPATDDPNAAPGAKASAPSSNRRQ